MKLFASIVLAALATSGGAQPYRPPYQPVEHRVAPPLLDRAAPSELPVLADMGLQIERDRMPQALLAAHRRLAAVLAGLAPQRKGVVDAYVVVAGLDSDPVFGREARAAAAVLARRYGAEKRTILLAGSDGTADSAYPIGSPDSLAIALARVAEVMDPAEDVLILYTTSHGAPYGIVYNDGDQGFGAVSPARLATLLSALGITNRLLLVSACYAGIFVPALASDTTAIVTASSADRTSFGCQADNDWTFFGDALINQALRKPQSLGLAAIEAIARIAAWEKQAELKPSQPQIAIGAGAARWLSVLERRLPPESPQVGRPAVAALQH